MAEGRSNPPGKVTGAVNCDVKDSVVVGWNTGTINCSAGGVDLPDIEEQTKEDIKWWTKDAVETAALFTVLDKINAGCSHVTITGSPGEGKSTLGFLVLRKLQETRRVYKVTSPKEFDAVMISSPVMTSSPVMISSPVMTSSPVMISSPVMPSSPVVLLDDIFGQTVFDEEAWKVWRESLERFLYTKEQEPSNETGNLILIGRDFVYRSGSRKVERPWEILTDSKHVVDISKGVVSDTQEKRKLVNSIAKACKIDLDQRTVEEICEVDTPHGFPHTCWLFGTLYKKDRRISAVEFFHKPLEFLKTTLKVVIGDNINRDIFMQLIKGDGCVSKDNLSKDADKSCKYIEQANDLCGTYLKLDRENIYLFDHPSILDTVSYLFCETKLSDILKHCSMKFITERVWLLTSDGETRDETEAGKLMAEINWSDAKKLAIRCGKEIGAGNSVNVKYHNAWTSDMFVKLMIDNMEADALNVGDRWPGDHTLLHRLCWENRANCVKMCLQKGADVNKKNSDGQTALHSAVVYGHIDIVHALCEFSGVDVNIKDKRGHTALHRAVDCRQIYIVRELCEVSGVELSIKDNGGQTALHMAARRDHAETVRVMCKVSGVYLNIKDSKGQTALHMAARRDHAETVRVLCEVSGVYLNIKDSKGQTALHMAARRDHAETVRVLCEVSGVDVNITDSDGQTVLQRAVVLGHTETVRVLCDVSMVDVNITDRNGWTSLHKAAVRGQTGIVGLLSKMSGVNVNIRDWKGRTVLHTAVEEEHTDIVRVLCEVSGVDVNIRDNDGQTALHRAARRGNTATVRVLCEVSDLDVHITDGVGHTALHMATRFGRTEIVRLLSGGYTYDRQ